MEGSTTTRFWKWVIAGLPATALTMILFAAQVGKDDATKNLQSYTHWLHLTWPEWLTAGQVMLVLGVLAIALPAYLFRKTLRALPRRLTAAYRAFRELPPVAPLPPSVEEVVAFKDVRAAFRLAGNPAAIRILYLSRDAQNSEDNVKWVTFRWLLNQEEARLRDIRSKLEGITDGRSDKPLAVLQRSLHEFIEVYGTVVRAVHDLGAEGVDFLGKRYADTYENWERLHADWARQLNTIATQPVLTQLGPVIEKNLRSAEGLRVSALSARWAKLLEAPSTDQRAFLLLYCVEETPSAENPIDYSVHAAGVALSNVKMLTLTYMEGGAHRFELPGPAMRAWMFSDFGSHPRRTDLEVYPSAVVHKVAPGGGTHG